MVIEVENLSKTYRSPLGRRLTRALDEVSLSVREGEIFGLVGPNGAGKTTLVRILTGLVRRSGGSARVFGVDVKRPGSRAGVGYLPEDPVLLRYMSVERMVRLIGMLAGPATGPLRERVAEAMKKAACEDFSKRHVKALSRGMLQRAALAAALASRPRLLFLDEPTANLDPLGRRHVRDMLLELRSRGTTIFLNSHLLSEIERVCDRIAILNRGRLARVGTLQELTQAEGRWVVRVRGEVGAEKVERIRKRLKGITVSAGEAGELVVDADELGLNALIDLLRAEGLFIIEVSKRTTTLEDVVVRLVGEEKA